MQGPQHKGEQQVRILCTIKTCLTTPVALLYLQNAISFTPAASLQAAPYCTIRASWCCKHVCVCGYTERGRQAARTTQVEQGKPANTHHSSQYGNASGTEPVIATQEQNPSTTTCTHRDRSHHANSSIHAKPRHPACTPRHRPAPHNPAPHAPMGRSAPRRGEDRSGPRPGP